MKRLSFNLLIAVGVLSVCFSTAAFAQQESVLNIRFDQPVAVPGMVLAPGSYTLRIPDSPIGAMNIEVLDSNGQFLRLVPIYPSSRTNVTDASAVMTETDNTGLARIDSFYFPAAHDGFRFIYNKKQLRESDIVAQQMREGKAASGQ